jgi:hypothetical protein
MADRLRVTELDFDTIKTNLKTFLNQQSEFTDYDFDGSGLSVLIDLLAYNTHYNAYYVNMVANEAFLDTALLRDSVVSHAKVLNYVPYSDRAPIAIVNLTVESGTSTDCTLTLPVGFSFLSNQIDSKSYNFVVLEDAIATKSNTQFFFENIKLYEGQLTSYNFTHNQSSNPKNIFTLPDTNIDTSTLKVTVQPSVSNTASTVYSKVTDVLDISSTSEVYFLQEGRNGNYQIYFGNGSVGKSLPDGAIVSTSYLLTNGTVANKANNFVATASLTDSLGNLHTNFIINPVSSAAGGDNREGVDNIKYSAAAQFSAQNRLVTFKDYESYILNNYADIDSISVWGGEDNTPPVYGKVFISLKPKNNYYISETEKERIVNEIITPKSIVSITPQILDPIYLYVVLKNTVKYTKSKTSLTELQLKSAINNAAISYNVSNLNKFNSSFVLSKYQDEIDRVDTNSIIGSEVIVRLQKRFEPQLGISATYNIDFNSKLHRGTTTNKLESSEFGLFDAAGILRTAQLEETPDSFTGISSISVVSAGIGYTSTPTVTITGDGIGAVAEAVIVNGKLESVNLISRGSGYTRALINLSGGNGYAASAVAVLDSRFGTLRTFYYDSNVQKQIINPNIGTIDYDTGLITLNSFRVISIDTPDSLIRLTIESESGILTSVRNTILTIDPDDSNAIETILIAS